MAHGMYAYLIVIDGIGCRTITFKPVFKHNISKEYGPACQIIID